MSTALSSLRQSVGRLMGSGDIAMVTGTPAATFSTTGFYCSALALEDDDYYNDWWLRFYSGTHKDITERVTDFTKSGGVIVFSPAVTGAVDATDLFELHRDFSPEEINNAINLAIQMVEDEALAEKSDATLAVLAATYEYAVPAGFAYIDEIYQEQIVADKYASSDLIDSRFWKIIDKEGVPYIWFDSVHIQGLSWPYSQTFGLTEGRNLRLVGQAKASTLSLDASTTDINPSYIIQQAKAILHQTRITGSGVASDMHDRQMVIAQNIANDLRKSVFVTPRGWKV
jgi:hypothetical protein